MGCCELKFKFPPEDEFGYAYEKYERSHEVFLRKEANLKQEIENNPEKLIPKLKVIEEYVNAQKEREEAYKYLIKIYNRQKESSTLGNCAEIKGNIVKEIRIENEKREKEKFDNYFSSILDFSKSKILNNQ